MLIAEYWTDGPVLETALERVPEMVLDLEEQYAEDDTARFIFWATGGDFTAFEAALDTDPTVTNPRTLTETSSRRLYSVILTDQVSETTSLTAMRELDLVRLSTEATHEGWSVRMRFPDREALRRFRSLHERRDFPFELRVVYQETDARSSAESRLTDRQREAILIAYEAGHFDVPQRASQQEVAAKLDIAPQSLSERLHRGLTTLIETTLSPERR